MLKKECVQCKQPFFQTGKGTRVRCDICQLAFHRAMKAMRLGKND